MSHLPKKKFRKLPKFLRNSRRLHLSFVFFVVWRFFFFFELSTGSVHCAPDEIDRPSEQAELYFAFVTLCCFLIIFLVSLLIYARKMFSNYLTLSNQNENSSLFTRSEKISAFKFALEYQKIDPY